MKPERHQARLILLVMIVGFLFPAKLRADLLFGTVKDAGGGTPNTSSTLVELNPATGGLIRTIGTIGYVVNGLTYDPTTHKLLASTSGSGSPAFTGLIEIDLATGAGTAIGAANFGQAVGARPVNNLEMGPGGTLYGWTREGDDLVTIDKTTGIATVAGDSGLNTSENGLAFDRSGTLYAVNRSQAKIYTVNPANGATTDTGNSLGTYAHHGDFDSSNRYFGIDNTGGQGTPNPRNLVVANLATGTILNTLPTVDDLHTIAFLPGPQPDNLIAGRGNNVYNLTGAGQTKPLVSKKARGIRTTLLIQNDAAIPDGATLQGARGNRLFRVVYRAAAGNISGRVTAGNYSTPNLAPGAADSVGIKIKPVRSLLLKQTNRGKKWLKKKRTFTLTSTSQGDPEKKDVARIKVRHR